jgi:hypothetical protein
MTWPSSAPPGRRLRKLARAAPKPEIALAGAATFGSGLHLAVVVSQLWEPNQKETSMLMRLLNGLYAAQAAENTAADLRRRYGAGAEGWCEKLLETLPSGDDRRATVRDIRRALRWTPAPINAERR